MKTLLDEQDDNISGFFPALAHFLVYTPSFKSTSWDAGSDSDDEGEPWSGRQFAFEPTPAQNSAAYDYVLRHGALYVLNKLCGHARGREIISKLVCLQADRGFKTGPHTIDSKMEPIYPLILSRIEQLSKQTSMKVGYQSICLRASRSLLLFASMPAPPWQLIIMRILDVRVQCP